MPAVSPPKDLNIYIGIDPGLNGGMTVLEGLSVEPLVTANSTLHQRWEFLASVKRRSEIKQCRIWACIEQQIARPTQWFDPSIKAWRSSILKSTCLLYGSFQQFLALLAAAEIPHEEITPQKWQKALDIPPREKGMKDSKWKGKLQAIAQHWFPRLQITLAVSDSFLIAEYCRRTYR